VDELQILLTIPEAARALRLSRTTVYKLLADGELSSVYSGRARRIPLQAVHDYVRRNESRSAA